MLLWFLAHPEFVAFQIDNLAGNVGHDNPWEWAEFDEDLHD